MRVRIKLIEWPARIARRIAGEEQTVLTWDGHEGRARDASGKITEIRPSQPVTWSDFGLLMAAVVGVLSLAALVALLR